MASTYSTNLRVELMATGENDSTWGSKLNTGVQLLEAAIAGSAAVTHDDTANYTLTTANGSADEARKMILNVGGALTAARNLVVPTVSKLYVVKNATTGGYAITVKTDAGTGISVPNGATMLLMCDGTNVVSALTELVSLALGGLLDLSAAGAGQIKFPASQNASADANTLDDYEEGTYTPTVSASTGTITTVTGASGEYTKTGREVVMYYFFTVTTNGTGAGAIRATLPFTATSYIYGTGRQQTDGNATQCYFISPPNTYANITNMANDTYPGADGKSFSGSIGFHV